MMRRVGVGVLLAVIAFSVGTASARPRWHHQRVATHARLLVVRARQRDSRPLVLAYDAALRAGNPSLADQLKDRIGWDADAEIDSVNLAIAEKALPGQIVLYDTDNPLVYQAAASLGVLPDWWLATLRAKGSMISIGARPVTQMGGEYAALADQTIAGEGGLTYDKVAGVMVYPDIAVNVVPATIAREVPWHEVTHFMAQTDGWNSNPEVVREDAVQVARFARENPGAVDGSWAGVCDPGPCEMLAISVQWWLGEGGWQTTADTFDPAYADFVGSLLR